MNENTLQGKWREIKGEIRKGWGKLTDDELEQTKGDMTAIGGLIQQRYGDSQDTYKDKLSDIYRRFEIKKDKAMEATKDKLRN